MWLLSFVDSFLLSCAISASLAVSLIPFSSHLAMNGYSQINS